MTADQLRGFLATLERDRDALDQAIRALSDLLPFYTDRNQTAEPAPGPVLDDHSHAEARADAPEQDYRTAHPNAQEEARAMYLDGHTCQQIATTLGAPFATVCAWSSRGQWRKHRLALQRKAAGERDVALPDVPLPDVRRSDDDDNEDSPAVAAQLARLDEQLAIRARQEAADGKFMFRCARCGGRSESSNGHGDCKPLNPLGKTA